MFNIGGGSQSGSGWQQGSGSSSGGSWIIGDDGWGDDFKKLGDDFFANLGSGPSIGGADFGTVTDVYQTLGEYYMGQINQTMNPDFVDAQYQKAYNDYMQKGMNIDSTAMGQGNVNSSRAGIAHGNAMAQSEASFQQALFDEKARLDNQAMAAAGDLAGLTRQYLSMSDDANRSRFLNELQQSNPAVYQLMLASGIFGSMAGWGGSSSSDWESSGGSESSGRNWGFGR